MEVEELCREVGRQVGVFICCRKSTYDCSGRMFSLLKRLLLLFLYVIGIFICVPLSLFVWWIRRKFFDEKSVAGDRKVCLLSDEGASALGMLVVIVHPEQWNGGSDRCTIGMIKHFVSAGHRVVWYTTMIDDYWQNENFGGVEIRDAKMALHPGDWFSQNVALAWQLIFSDLDPDLIVIDHSASCVPMIKWRFPRVKILFYCHFPQQLVTPSRFFLYRWYSKAIGLIEGTMFNSADLIMVNSHFTERQFLRVMPDVCPSKLMVVYPPCDVDSTSIGNKPISRKQRAHNVHYTFLSMNRFWPEKRLDIIVEAANMLKSRNRRPRILLAGSVMPHIPESRIYYELLKKMVDDLNVSDLVEFIDSPTEAEKFALYRQCDTVLYTPPNEHFGIVPIEALEQRRPVIVCNSGGPAETVLEGITGSKIEFPDGQLLAEAMEQHMLRPIWPALDNDEDYELQRKRFDFNFSLIGFRKRIDDALAMMLPESRSSLTVSATARKYA